MKKVCYLLFLLATSFLVGQNNTAQLFEKANKNYKEGNYELALDLYKQIEEGNAVSSELYYNMANSYYKLNRVGQTIYYYEKALQLDPLNEDAANNLTFARRMTIDTIEELPKTFLQKIENNYIQKLSYTQWSILAIVCSFVAAICFLLFYISSISNRKRLYFLLSIFSCILLAISLSISYTQHTKRKEIKTAIIFSSKISVNNSPTLNSEEIFVLHEGTKIMILDSVDHWKKIKLANGKIGWISADALKEL